MALKFLNKKGWHTGSLRNIENVWKAEQKHEAEERKLEELKKQIHDEREAHEFRLLQEQAGLVPKQERLEFLYNSGLAVGKSSSDEYLLGKPIEAIKGDNEIAKAAAAAAPAPAPGALFVEEKPHSANDTWRKLHSDPLLLIRQQEQAALARIKNNPVKMDLIRKSVENKLSKKEKKEKRKNDERQQRKENKRKKKSQSDSSERSSNSTGLRTEEIDHRVKRRHSKPSHERDWNASKLEKRSHRQPNDTEVDEFQNSKRSRHDRDWNASKLEKRSHRQPNDTEVNELQDSKRSMHGIGPHRKRHDSPDSFGNEVCKQRTEDRECFKVPSSNDVVGRDVKKSSSEGKVSKLSKLEIDKPKDCTLEAELYQKSKQRLKYQAGKLSEKEKAARLKDMQVDAEVHEEQRWHRLKRASDADVLEEARKSIPSGRNFLDITTRNVYGAEEGGSASIEESVRRRAHFIERSIGDGNTNTFRR